eukprot:1152374-Pelagomonas_calceolata.AAC.2
MADIMEGEADWMKQDKEGKQFQLADHQAHKRTTQGAKEGFQKKDMRNARMLWFGVCWSASNARPMSALATHPMQLSITNAKRKHWQKQAFNTACSCQQAALYTHNNAAAEQNWSAWGRTHTHTHTHTPACTPA